MPSRRRLLLWLWAATAGLFLIRLFAAGLTARAHTATGPPLSRPVKIDLNRARVPELVALPGIGRRRAQAIVLHRVRHGPFSRLSDLLEVDGIGPGTVDGLRSEVLPLPGESR